MGGLFVVLALVCLILGAVVAGLQKAWLYTLAFAAGAFLILAEAVRALK